MTLFEVKISYIDGRKWTSAFSQTNDKNKIIEVSKMASIDSTYSFCLNNLGPETSSIIVRYMTGLEMMDF